MARIGLLSDSHGRAGTTRRAVDLLRGAGAEVLVHLGDVGTIEVVDALCVDALDTDDQLEAHMVFGNTDWDRDALAKYADDLDVIVDDPVGRLPLLGPAGNEDGVLLFCHGHVPQDLDTALAENPRYLCHGHTHRTLDTHHGSTRIINPGALFRASAYTVAILDTNTDRLTFHEIAASA